MPRHRVSLSARISAPAALCSTLITEYCQHHPRNLPDACARRQAA
jgi:hypothetical protein